MVGWTCKIHIVDWMVIAIIVIIVLLAKGGGAGRDGAQIAPRIGIRGLWLRSLPLSLLLRPNVDLHRVVPRHVDMLRGPSHAGQALADPLYYRERAVVRSGSPVGWQRRDIRVVGIAARSGVQARVEQLGVLLASEAARCSWNCL
jgi:hypothetical protein